MRLLLIISLSIISFAGCDKKKVPIENPEGVDLIYLDMQKELATAKAQVAALEKEVADKKGIMKRAPIRTGERDMFMDNYFNAEKKLQKAREVLKYWEVVTPMRKSEARQKYAVAFEKDLPWPSHEDYEVYKLEKRNRFQSKEWDSDKRVWAYKKARKAAKAAAAAPPSGGHH